MEYDAWVQQQYYLQMQMQYQYQYGAPAYPSQYGAYGQNQNAYMNQGYGGGYPYGMDQQ